MNDNDPILAELRKISAYVDLQRKVTKWSLICVAILFPAMIIFAVVMEHKLKTNLDDIATEPKPDWYDVDRNVRLGNYAEAIHLGEELILRTPQYPDAHQSFADAYLAAGKIEKAREHYAEAFRLFPSEANEKRLMAIDKRIKAESLQPVAQTNGNQPLRSETNRVSSADGDRH